MKRIVMALVIIAIAVMAVSGVYAQTAPEIIRSSRERIQFDTKSTRSRMVILAKDGGATERLVDQYSSEGHGPKRKMFIFQKPASVANTRFLTIENVGKAEDRWIFLPSFGKVRRISKGEGSGSFLGTDMSFDDISSTDRESEADDHRLLREESSGGKNYWVIESIPKDSGYQYSRMISWIEKETRIALKIELYDKKGELAKVMEILAVEDRQGRLTSTVTKMSTVKAKTSTTIYAEIIKYDDPIPENVFTVGFLETGRP